jgi:hypothetical protein
MTTSVFISHVASESEVAVWIKKEIGGLLRGAIAFFVSSDGEQIIGGDKWLDKILAALNESSTVLVLCSEKSVHRPWVNFEAGGAWMAGKRVVPLCHGSMNPGKLPQPLASLQAYSLYNRKDLRHLVSLLAESAGVESPQYDADALIRTLPPLTQDSTNANSLPSSKAKRSRTRRNTGGAPDQRVNLSDYEHDKRSGIYRHKMTREAVCKNCLLLHARVSPLSESPAGWRCDMKDCGKFYSNPDFNPPPDEPYDPMTYLRR